MKRILGLDLGTNSIGWAVVNEKESNEEKSSIERIGVRVVPLTTEEQQSFDKGKAITTNAKRTEKHGMRLNLFRYKMRRSYLIKLLKDGGLITDDTLLAENGNRTTFETYRLRAKAADEEIGLEELARVLLMINKKRGYKSNRKVKSEDEDGQIIDGMDVARHLYDNNLTPGQYASALFNEGKRNLPDFYRSDLKTEFDKVWNFQKAFYPNILTDELHDALQGKNEKQTWAICEQPFNVKGVKRTTKGFEQTRENYKWRAESLKQKMELEQLIVVLQKINGQINSSSGYLGAISDRSKELYFNHQTVGQYLMSQLDANPNCSLKNQVFYRQDYLDEFERVWETQARFHKELTPELKHKMRDCVIFYQRPLKSQKGLISFCEFESQEKEFEIDGKKKFKMTGLRVSPKSSPLFQEFRIWQTLNNVLVSGKIVPDRQIDLFGESVTYKQGKRCLEQEEKEILFGELSVKEKLTKSEILKLLFKNHKELDLNFKEIKGNTTQAALFKAYQKIIELSGHGEHNFTKMSANEITDMVSRVFSALGFNTGILSFDSSIEGKAFERQPAYRLWHLLYSYEGDKSVTGNDRLVKKIAELFDFDEEYAKVIANVAFEQDYGSLSAKAMRKILPYMRDGVEYSEACALAGYRHSKRSLTSDEIEGKELKDHIRLLPRNSLRNPVVEKILNQMINLVNSLMIEYGTFDEIRIEMARELKKSAKEREETVKAISKATKENDEYRKVLEEVFGMKNVSRNDIIRYRLYCELQENGFKTLYSKTYIQKEKLFSKEFDIEHIIPQSKLFDDSFANKTIEVRSVNIEKGNMTALDYVESKYDKSYTEKFKDRIEALYKKGAISKTKRNRLLTKEEDIPEGFIDRDLRNTQYIARKACEILEQITKTVVATTGSVTDRLREDWQLVDVMKELNWNKYDKVGLTEIVKDKDGRNIRHIKDWTKRNDQRHHAMDALTIAFTKHSFIQYLNHLNARSNKADSIYGIEKKELYRDDKGKLKFVPPMPLNEFRAEAKRQLNDILVSIKAKNKVVTQNVNTTKTPKNGKRRNEKVQLTPRGQLHNETIYGSIKQYVTKTEAVGSAFDMDKIATAAAKKYRDALMRRLNQFSGDAKKAFTGGNSLDKNPVWVDEAQTKQVPSKVKTVTLETIYTQRKEINKDLKVDKVISKRIRTILENRLNEFGGNADKAFSNLDENPIWLNKENGIAIKRVTIKGVNEVEALHEKRDHNGKLILDHSGKLQPTDFVSTSNNHHVAIFRDADGNLQEHIMSFYEATARAIQHQSIIDKDYRKADGWQFLFTMKQNEYFVFPNQDTGFNPEEIDLFDPKNFATISPNLFRVQKLSSKNYVFRHHLETKVDDTKELQGVTWKRITALKNLKGIVKVRIDNIGKIVAVGEY